MRRKLRLISAVIMIIIVVQTVNASSVYNQCNKSLNFVIYNISGLYINIRNINFNISNISIHSFPKMGILKFMNTSGGNLKVVVFLSRSENVSISLNFSNIPDNLSACNISAFSSSGFITIYNQTLYKKLNNINIDIYNISNHSDVCDKYNVRNISTLNNTELVEVVKSNLSGDLAVVNNLAKYTRYIWRYDVVLSAKYIFTENRSELQKVKNIAKELEGKNIIQDTWNILLWEQQNLRYNQTKASLQPPKIVLYGNFVKVVNAGRCRYIQTPYETVEKRNGICSDFAILTDALLVDMNESCYLVLIKFQDGSTHAAAAVNIDGWYIFLDQHLPPMDMWSYYNCWAENGKKIKCAIFFKINRDNVSYAGTLSGLEFKQRYPYNVSSIKSCIGSMLLGINLTPLPLVCRGNCNNMIVYQYYPYYCGLYYREYASLCYSKIVNIARNYKFFWLDTSRLGNGLLIKYIFSN